MITSNSNPQPLHLNSMSQYRARATLLPQFGHASHEFRRVTTGSIYDSLSPFDADSLLHSR